MQVQQLNIPVTESLQLLIYANSAPLFEEQDASDYGESKWQLQEGKEYDFEGRLNSINRVTKKDVEDIIFRTFESGKYAVGVVGNMKKDAEFVL